MTGSTTNSACRLVWTFDTDDNGNTRTPQMSGDLDTYSSNPLWKVVDRSLAIVEASTSRTREDLLRAEYLTIPGHKGR